MKYEQIQNLLFIQNRTNLASMIKGNGIVILNSNDTMPINADGTMPFRQNSDLFYLTGIDQEETRVIIFPTAANPLMKEILFIRETNEQILIWEGYKLTKEQARDISGIETIFWTHQFEQIFNGLVFDAETIYINSNEHIRSENKVQTSDTRFLNWCKEIYPLHSYSRLAPILQNLRLKKSVYEVDLTQKAIDITEKGFRRVLNFVKPGVMEYEIEAEFVHEFMINRGEVADYSPIIASGANACILHYTQNDQLCKSGDLILIDVGASYANYNADMTRVIPVNGKFSSRQKQIYQSVLRILRFATSQLIVGNTFENLMKSVGEFATQELVLLNLLTIEECKNPLAYKKYFMHGVSHFLGLDVHDVGSRYVNFVDGILITCEPGIYIREEGIGIRLENNILITSNGPIDLMKNIPIETDEIESLMNL